MPHSIADDVRLRATETQMRRALGLQDATPRSRDDHQPSPTAHRSPRRFVRDGEVPVTVVHRDHHRDDAASTNQLETVRQALAEQTAATKHAERSLEKAEATIRDLQTKLAQECLAKGVAFCAAHRAAAEVGAIQQTMRAVQDELLSERFAHQNAEQECEDVITARTIG